MRHSLGDLDDILSLNQKNVTLFSTDWSSRTAAHG
jgi:hypothetical protein